MAVTAELYGRGVLAVTENDVLFSAAKLAFAYGLGNAQTFALAAGATAVLMAERATPASVFKRLAETRPTIFYAVPTLYGAMLASPEFPKEKFLALRLCVSAGEALPADMGRRWQERTGGDMLRVSGFYVSPAEVEAALVGHEAVLEAAVVGHEDDNRLIKPKAFVVLKEGRSPSEALKATMQQHIKDRLAPYKYPRWIEFVNELPKTATGKIQRFKLRG